jgi:carboxylesterase
VTKITPALSASTFYSSSAYAVLMLHGQSSSPLDMRHFVEACISM